MRNILRIFGEPKISMTIPISPVFSLRTVINSHGWYDLLPFSTNDRLTELSAVISLSPARHVPVTVSQSGATLKVLHRSPRRLTITEKERIKNSVRSLLRLNEPMEEFYALCRKEPHLRWVPRRGAGRLLRSPTMFEDVVKMLFTTNCSWALTKIQTNNLVRKLGTKIDGDYFSFPSPESIAQRSEAWLRKELSCGYRAPYLLALCRGIAARRIELESLRTSDLPTEELYKQLRAIKGIGHYAAGNLLKLIGRYDYLGIDSWVRKRFAQVHRRGRKTTDTAIEDHYQRYGKWRGLVCWMDVTADWHEER